MDIDLLVQKAVALSKGIYGKIYMGDNSCILGATNENQNEISKILEYNGKRILTTGSSGDQYLSAVVNGSKNETIFDINIFTKYYVYLKIAAIRNLNLKDYVNFMLPYNSENNYFNNNIIKFISKELPRDVDEFWYKYLSEVEKKEISNFIYFEDKKIEHILYRLDYINELKYKLLQNKLKEKNYPKVLNFDANYFFSYINKEIEKYGQYEVINFSNIIECNKLAHWDDYYYGLYNDEEWIKYFNDIKSKILTQGGVLFLYKKYRQWLDEYKNNFDIKEFKNDIYEEQVSYGLTLKRN